MAADVNAIIVGYNGRVTMLRAIFGGDDPETENLQPMTPDMMRGIFGPAH